MEIRIRALEPGDLEDVHAITTQRRCIAGTMLEPLRHRELTREWLAREEPNARRIAALVEVDGRETVVGVLGLRVEPKARRSHVATLGMYVHDAYQGRGVGDALMTAAIDLASRWLQITRIELSVYADNEAAIGLYEKHGFLREGLHPRFAFRDGEYVDTISMAWLAPGVR